MTTESFMGCVSSHSKGMYRMRQGGERPHVSQRARDMGHPARLSANPSKRSTSKATSRTTSKATDRACPGFVEGSVRPTQDDFGVEEGAGDAGGNGEQFPLAAEDFDQGGAGKFG